MSVDKTARKPNFKADIDTYGTWGESLFISSYSGSFKEKKYGVYNVSKDPFFQVRDVDFVIAKKPLYENYDGLDNDKEFPDEFPDDMKDAAIEHPDFEKIEVKVDTRTIDTGNIPYEVISHAQLGWCLVTKCDKVFFIIARENEEGLTPIKGLWLDMNKWREFIADRTTRKISNLIRSEQGIADLLCKVKDLEEYGVVIGEKSFSNYVGQ